MIRDLIFQAIICPDDYVLSFEYTDRHGVRTRRIASPIRFLSDDRFLALCLCREEPRQFYLWRCRNIQLVDATDILMPEEITVLDPTKEKTR